jgi:hypothetical protein
MNKRDCIKLKGFCFTKPLNSRDRPQNGRKYLPAIHLDKRLISSIYKKLKKLNLQRINIPMKKWEWKYELNKNCSKEEV